MEPVESMESGKAKVSEKDRKPETKKSDETRKPEETEKPDESGKSETEKPDEARQPEEAEEPDKAGKPDETEEPVKAGKPDEIKKPDEATKPEEERTQKAQKFLPALKPAQVKLKAIFEESALHLPQILQKGTTQPRRSAGETTLTRSAKRLSSMVERLHEERQAGSGEVPQRAVKMGPAVVKDYGKVLDKLYQQRAKLPQPPALFVLKTEEAEALRRDRWSAKSRMMVYGEHGPQRRTRVTTPDMAETQKRRKQRKRQEEAQRESD